jgi:hypothetical protein
MISVGLVTELTATAGEGDELLAAAPEIGFTDVLGAKPA